MPHSWNMGQILLIPLWRKACWGFLRPKNPTASAGFEPANLGAREAERFNSTLSLVSAPCGGVWLTPRPINKKETFILISQTMNLFNSSTHCWSALLFLYQHLLLMKCTYFVLARKLCLPVSKFYVSVKPQFKIMQYKYYEKSRFMTFWSMKFT